MFDWLKQYQRLTERIRYIEFKIQQSEIEWRRWTHGDLEHTHLGKDSNSAGLPEYIARDKLILADLKDHRETLVKFIESFDDLNSQILRKKYIENKSLYEISEELAYSYGYIRQCHSELVLKIKENDKYLLDYFDTHDDDT